MVSKIIKIIICILQYIVYVWRRPDVASPSEMQKLNEFLIVNCNNNNNKKSSAVAAINHCNVHRYFNIYTRFLIRNVVEWMRVESRVYIIYKVCQKCTHSKRLDKCISS